MQWDRWRWVCLSARGCGASLFASYRDRLCVFVRGFKLTNNVTHTYCETPCIALHARQYLCVLYSVARYWWLVIGAYQPITGSTPSALWNEVSAHRSRWSFSDGVVAIHRLLPVLRMTSYSHTTDYVLARRYRCCEWRHCVVVRRLMPLLRRVGCVVSAGAERWRGRSLRCAVALYMQDWKMTDKLAGTRVPVLSVPTLWPLCQMVVRCVVHLLHGYACVFWCVSGELS